MFARIRVPYKVIISTLMFVTSNMVSGFSFADIGGVRQSEEVTRSFREYRYDPGYRYFYLNSENNPFAVMGIRNDFTFHAIAWTEVNPNSEKFKKVIDLVRLFPRIGRTTGAYILDAQAGTIGVWYSSQNVGVVVDNNRKTVSIQTRTIGGQK